jgi:NADH dehydrogenase
MITIAGGTGTLGSALIPRLAERGLPLRVLTRDADRAATRLPPVIETVTCDVRDPEAVRHALAGSSTVISAVQGFGGPDAAGAAAIDRDGNHHLISAARALGVEHLILMSVAQAAPDHPIELFRMKYEAEQDLRASGLAWTIIRPTAYMETWVSIIGRPLLETGKTRIFGRGDNPINFVSAHDVAALVELAVVEPGLRGQVIEIGGPEDVTLNGLADRFEAVTGKAGARDHAPVPVMRLMSAVLRPFKPGLAGMIGAGVVMDTRDMRADTTETRCRYPSIPTTDLDEMMRRDYRSA